MRGMNATWVVQFRPQKEIIWTLDRDARDLIRPSTYLCNVPISTHHLPWPETQSSQDTTDIQTSGSSGIVHFKHKSSSD